MSYHPIGLGGSIPVSGSPASPHPMDYHFYQTREAIKNAKDNTEKREIFWDFAKRGGSFFAHRPGELLWRINDPKLTAEFRRFAESDGGPARNYKPGNYVELLDRAIKTKSEDPLTNLMEDPSYRRRMIEDAPTPAEKKSLFKDYIEKQPSGHNGNTLARIVDAVDDWGVAVETAKAFRARGATNEMFWNDFLGGLYHGDVRFISVALHHPNHRQRVYYMGLAPLGQS